MVAQKEPKTLEELRASWKPSQGCLWVDAQMQDGVLGERSNYEDIECPCPDCDDTPHANDNGSLDSVIK